IGDLTGDQFATARSRRNLANDLCRRVTPGRLCARGDFECNGEKTIAGEDSDAFPKDFVAGGAATTKIVIIHARQIVMHERVGVNAFYRGSERKCIGYFAATSLRRNQTKNRSKAFTAGKKT